VGLVVVVVLVVPDRVRLVARKEALAEMEALVEQVIWEA